MDPSALLCVAAVRSFRVFNYRVKIVLRSMLALFAGQLYPAAHAQTVHFSGTQITVASNGVNTPVGIAVDGSGNVYIADAANSRVLKEALLAGSYTESTVVSNLPNLSWGIAVDGSGNVYISVPGNNQILKETLSAGTYTQSTVGSGLNQPTGVAVDANGNVYIADTVNNQVLKETLSAGSYTQSTVASSGLNFPWGVAVDGNGNVYISDANNNRVLKETLSAGSYTQSTVASSGLNNPYGVAVDGSSNVYIADTRNNRVLKETLAAGSYAQSTVVSSSLNTPWGVAVDGNGNSYVSDTNSNRVLRLSTAAANFGTVSVGSLSSVVTLFFTFDTGGTIGTPAVLAQGVAGLDFADAGTGTCTTNGTGHAYSVGDTCSVDVIFTPKSPGLRYGAAVLQDSSGNRIATGYIQGTGAGPQVNFLPGTQSTLSFSNVVNPYAIAGDAAGNLYIVKAIQANSSSNAVVKETWTGSGYTQSTIATGFAYPVSVAVDGAGNVYIADQNGTKVVMETPSNGGYTPTVAFNSLGNVEAVAVDGSGNVYISSLAHGLLKETLTAGNYAQSTVVGNVYAYGIAVDGQGNIYLGDNVNNQVLKETLSNGSYTQSTVASGLNGPHGVAVDGSGNVYIADTFGSRIAKETLSGGVYTQSTVASGLNDPLGVAVDGSGNIFLCSDASSSVWKVNYADPPSLSFAATNDGSTSGSQTVTVENIGDAALSFPVLSAGNNPSIATNFSLDSSGGSACPLVSTNSSTAGTLAAGSSCLLSISFAPTTSGTITGSLVLTDTNLNAAAPNYATQSIGLSGTGLGPDVTSTTVTAVASSIAFGQSTTLHVTVADAANNGLTPAGSVTFTDMVGSAITTAGTATLTSGTATLSYSPAAIGSHAITASYTPSNPAAFNSSSNSVSLTVTQTTPVLTWANPSAIQYGTALGSTQFNTTASVPGSFVYTPATGAVPSAGTGSLSVIFTPTDTVDYTTATKSVSLVVNQQATAVTLTLGATSIVPGQILTLTARVTAALSGTPTGTVTFLDGSTTLGSATLTNGGATYSTTALASGSHILSVTYSGDTNYAVSSSGSNSNAVTVSALDFSLANTGLTSQTVHPGGTANFSLALTPTYGSYPAAVTFTLSGLPSGASATFSPSTIAVAAGPQTVALTIQTSTVAANDSVPLRREAAPLTLALLLLPIAGARRWRRSERKMAQYVTLALLLWVAVAGSAGLSGCAGNGSGSTQQNYTVTVTASAGTVQHVTTVALTVQ